jgi:hypothetical protein
VPPQQDVTGLALFLLKIRRAMTETTLDVRNQFLSDAADAMDAMAGKATTTARCYRRAALAEAHPSLVELLSELRQFPALVDALRGTLTIDASHLTRDDVPLDVQVARLNEWLEQLIQAHTRRDWLTLADVLELGPDAAHVPNGGLTQSPRRRLSDAARKPAAGVNPRESYTRLA